MNLNDSPKEDDMTSVRGYFTKHLIVTTSNHDIDSLQSIANHIRDGFGPKIPAALLFLFVIISLVIK
ncbi:hypothetical protein Q8W16_12365 [Photobacterium damselae subsp. piscicida]|nr:hypothetical protein [Photobacterium damselae subsp. piscicida]